MKSVLMKPNFRSHSNVSLWYTWPWLIISQKSFSEGHRYLGRRSVYQCKSITLKAETMSHQPSTLTAGQRVAFTLEEQVLLQQQLLKPHPPSTLHSRTMGKWNFRTRKIPTNCSKQQEETESLNHNTHTCPGIWSSTGSASVLSVNRLWWMD